jgi:hypothetical protein
MGKGGGEGLKEDIKQIAKSKDVNRDECLGKGWGHRIPTPVRTLSIIPVYTNNVVADSIARFSH